MKEIIEERYALMRPDNRPGVTIKINDIEIEFVANSKYAVVKRRNIGIPDLLLELGIVKMLIHHLEDMYYSVHRNSKSYSQEVGKLEIDIARRMNNK